MTKTNNSNNTGIDTYIKFKGRIVNNGKMPSFFSRFSFIEFIMKLQCLSKESLYELFIVEGLATKITFE